MGYRIVVTSDAEEDLDRFIKYLLFELGYRRINFLSHRYSMMYRIVDQVVFIDNIFHQLQDCEDKMH